MAEHSTATPATKDPAVRSAELAHLSRMATMGQLASGVAHELNQPLAAILNYASVCLEFLQSGNGSQATALTAMREILNETRRAGGIISRMRSFSSKQQPVIAPVDLNKLVRDSLSLMDFELRYQQICPALELQEDLPRVSCDAVQIEQVLVNVIFNALQAMAEIKSATHRLTVRTALRDGRVEVSIIDTGRGMPPEVFSRLFEPFFTTKKNGMGMGLNISRSIVEIHGGRLNAGVNPDGGMRFTFTLPIETTEV